MKTKILVGVALGLFFLIVTSIGVAGLVLFEQKKAAGGQKLASADLTAVGGPLESQTDGSLGGITLADVAKHATQSDCWMAIEGNVYNFTDFLRTHPGGAAAMIPYCGADGSAAFATKDMNPGKPHTAFARELLNSYFLGKLASGNLADNNSNGGGGGSGKTPTIKPAGNTTGAGNSSANLPATSSSGTILTTSEVARHATSGDCWLIISNNVYNVSSYLSQHPGGAAVIANYCGADATNAFATKNTGSSHSSNAVSLLGNYIIGRIGSTVASTNPVGSGSTTGSGSTGSTGSTGSGSTGSSGSSGSGSTGSTNVTLTTAQVATHNTLQDCWLIINNRVYDVTRYIVVHPGGQNAIARHCGQEATTAFQIRDGSGSHSQNANNLLNNYLIGNLNDTIVVAPPSGGGGGGSNPTATPIPLGNIGGSSGNLPGAILARYPGATRSSGSYEDNGSWEGKVNTSSGCREMKVNSSGVISEDKSC